MAKSIINGMEIKINRAELIENVPSHKGVPGSIIGVEKAGFLVKTNDSFIKIIEWEFADKQNGIQLGQRFRNENCRI